MLLAAGIEPKVISQMLGHATVAFTMDVYTEVAEELAQAAAEAIAAFIPSRGQPGLGSSDMSPEEAGQMLSERVIVTHDLDTRVRAVVTAGLTKHRMHLLTGRHWPVHH
jgi:hypothetical protein